MSVSTLKSHIWCETVSLCAISSIILLKYQVVAKEILNYNGCDWKTSFLLLHFQTYEIVTFYSIKMNNKNFISALAILNLLIPSIHIMMTKKNCSSVRYLIWARKNCLVSLILKLSIDLILAFHTKLFGSRDLSGLISSAFKDITKIPFNSQLFDFIGYRKYPPMLFQVRLYLRFQDDCCIYWHPQAPDCWGDDWRNWGIVVTTIPPQI